MSATVWIAPDGEIELWTLYDGFWFIAQTNEGFHSFPAYGTPAEHGRIPISDNPKDCEL